MRDTLSDMIYNQLITNITSGVWPAGSKLPTEAELCAQYGASRTSVRQALAKLTALGLVESKRGSGTTVKNDSAAAASLSDIVPTIMFEAKEHLQVFEFHCALQNECVKLACNRYTEEQMERMEYCYKQMVTCHENHDPVSRTYYDMECHKVICEMTGNPMFVRALEIIYSQLKAVFEAIASDNDFRDSITFHRRLITALKDRNVLFASAIMEAHMQDTYTKFLNISK